MRSSRRRRHVLWESAPEPSPALFYELAAEGWFAAPMVLVNRVQQLLMKGKSPETAINEYWSPGPSWRWLESFTASCTVLRQVAAPTDLVSLLAAQERYHRDVERARNEFPG
jgi:hypothetical protein